VKNAILWSDGTEVTNNASTPVISNSVVQGGYAGGTNIITSDPKLSSLGNYGGNTQTIPLLPGSSAMNTGNDAVCSAAVGALDYGAGGKDQRGIARPQGTHCDIGAYEYVPKLLFLPLILR
jgi:hypothetical protein